MRYRGSEWRRGCRRFYICPVAALKDGKALRLHCRRHLIRTPRHGAAGRTEAGLRCQIRPPVTICRADDQLTSPSICLDRRAALGNEEMEAASSWRPLSPALLSVMVPTYGTVGFTCRQQPTRRIEIFFSCLLACQCHVWLGPAVRFCMHQPSSMGCSVVVVSFLV